MLKYCQNRYKVRKSVIVIKIICESRKTSKMQKILFYKAYPTNIWYAKSASTDRFPYFDFIPKFSYRADTL